MVTLLGSLPPSFSTLVTALEARDAVSLSYVQQSLICEEQKLLANTDTSSGMGHSRALVRKHHTWGHKTKGYEHMRVCYLCGEPGRYC